MSSMCHKCITDCVSDYITCIKCDSFVHFKCMHAAGIIKNPWSNSNKLPAYALSILNFDYHLIIMLSQIYYYSCNYLFVLLFQLNAYKRPSFSTESINLRLDRNFYY